MTYKNKYSKKKQNKQITKKKIRIYFNFFSHKLGFFFKLSSLTSMFPVYLSALFHPKILYKRGWFPKIEMLIM